VSNPTASNMKERPIPFSDAMALAAFNGSKTQTRRIVKPQPDARFRHLEIHRDGCVEVGISIDSPNHYQIQCPYGAVGDRLWVRESYYQFGHWEPVTNAKTKGGKQKWKFVADFREIRFENPAGSALRLGRHSKDSESMAWHKRLARFMPRSACRNVLKITGIRIERLQDITHDDSMREGIMPVCDVSGKEFGWLDYTEPDSLPFDYNKPRASFKSLWDTINGPASWHENPWVWVIEFKRVQTP